MKLSILLVFATVLALIQYSQAETTDLSFIIEHSLDQPNNLSS